MITPIAAALNWSGKGMIGGGGPSQREGGGPDCLLGGGGPDCLLNAGPTASTCGPML